MRNKLGGFVVVLVTLSLVVAAIAAFKPLIGIYAWEQQCGELVAEDGGYGGQSAVRTGAGGAGFNSVVCTNLTSNAVYFGGSTVAASSGYPICTTSSCAGKTLSLDTHGGQMYCATAANLDGGYQPVRCMSGK
jgi:hypothetical protein